LRHAYRLAVAAALLTVASCDRGLAPPEPSKFSTLSGQVHFAGVMPPCDSVKALAVVLSQQAAPFSVTDIINNFNKTIFAVSLTPCSFQDTSFVFTLTPGTYRYLGVAQLYGDSINHDWRIVAFAHTPEDSAIVYNMNPGSTDNSTVLTVRFDTLIRQPFIQ
jgi:hypothetical protein